MRASLVLLLLAAPLYAQSPSAAGTPYALTPPGTFDARVSPDGRRVALAGVGYATLQIADLVRNEGRLALAGAPQTVLEGGGVGYGFAWTDDGALVARQRGEDGSARVVAVEAAGETDVLARSDGFTSPPAVAGASVAVASEGEAAYLRGDADVPVLTGSSLALARAGGSTVVWQSPSGMPLLNLAIAPTGRVAFEVVGGSLWSMNADGTDAVDHGPGEQPAWSPDGRWLAFVRTTDDGHEITGSDLWSDVAEGGQAAPLAVTPDRLELRPAWGPGGSDLLYHELGRGGIDVLPITFQ